LESGEGSNAAIAADFARLGGRGNGLSSMSAAACPDDTGGTIRLSVAGSSANLRVVMVSVAGRSRVVVFIISILIFDRGTDP